MICPQHRPTVNHQNTNLMPKNDHDSPLKLNDLISVPTTRLATQHEMLFVEMDTIELLTVKVLGAQTL